MKHELIVIDETTVGCTCRQWKKEVAYETTDKQMVGWHANHKKAVAQKEIRGVYRDLGMKRVRGNLGGVYYE